MDRRRLIGGLGLAVVLAAIATDGFQGERTYSSETGWSVWRRLDPLTLGLAPLAGAALILSWCLPARPGSEVPASWFRVFLAIFIEFALFSIATGPPLSVIDLWLEAVAVGEFHWSYERTFSRSTDYLSLVLGLPFMALFWLWFGRNPWSGRETPGRICTGVTFEATVARPGGWQVAVAPVKLIALAMPFVGTFFKGHAGYDIRGVRQKPL